MKPTNWLGVSCLAVASMLASCGQQKDGEAARKSFIATENFDSSVKPGDNFFLFVNGKWIKSTEIPATETGAGSFNDLYNRTKANLKGIIEDAAKSSAAAGSIEQKVGDFYTAGMDSATIDKRGYEPVKPYLAKIDAIKDAKDVIAYVAEDQVENKNTLFAQGFNADEKNSGMNIAIYYQGGIGLPDRDYYFKTDSATAKVVKAYQAYIAKLFELTGTDAATAAKNAQAV